jgi:hypothetical protein
LYGFIKVTIRKFAPVFKQTPRFEDVRRAEGIATRYLKLNTTQISYQLETSGERIFTPFLELNPPSAVLQSETSAQ